MLESQLEVKRLADALSNEAPFSSQLERVEVRRFGAGDALADAAIRVFDIEGAFRPRRLVKAGSLRPGGQGAR